MLAVTYNGKIYSVDVQKMDNISPSLNNKTHPPSLIQPTLLTQPLSQNSISQINDEMIKTITNEPLWSAFTTVPPTPSRETSLGPVSR